MNDLNTLLDRAAGPAAAPVDAHTDLRRGHHALARTRRRRSAAGLLGVAAAGVVGVGLTRTGGHDKARDPGGPQVATSPTTPPATVVLVTRGAYSFPTPPERWEVQGDYPQGVTIGPVGDTDTNPYSFEGKLAIGYDQNPPSGRPVTHEGETYWVGGGDYVSIARKSRPEEPRGEVLVQYPASTGWSTDDMIAFLNSVHVGPDARPGFG